MTQTFTPIDEIKDARSRKKTRQAFYTPLSLVKLMVETSRIHSGALCLEPSGGDGRIVHAMIEAGGTVEACETDDAMHARCKSLGAKMVAKDFLAYGQGQRYDQIIMNPPFTRGQADRHIEHAYSMLKSHGELVSIAPNSVAERLHDCSLNLPGCSYAVYEVLPPETFKESGACPKTILVTILGDAPGGEVEGFSNGATNNVALTITSDKTFWDAAQEMRSSPDQLRSRFSREVGKLGGSCYGVNWDEVAKYIRFLINSAKGERKRERKPGKANRIQKR